MAKTVRPNLNRAEIFDGINLKRSGNEFAPNVGRVAEHFRESFACLLAIGQSALVVIKLHVVGEHRDEKIDIVRVKGAEHLCIQLGDGFEQLRGFGNCERRLRDRRNCNSKCKDGEIFMLRIDLSFLIAWRE
jgi:hypothetical protein